MIQDATSGEMVLDIVINSLLPSSEWLAWIRSGWFLFTVNITSLALPQLDALVDSCMLLYL